MADKTAKTVKCKTDEIIILFETDRFIRKIKYDNQGRQIDSSIEFKKTAESGVEDNK